jgi:hypothetical protein
VICVNQEERGREGEKKKKNEAKKRREVFDGKTA